MGQKIHPTGFRLAVSRNWASRWYASNTQFAGMLKEDIEVREFLKKKLKNASVGRVVIERPAKNARITIYSSRPGVVIGKKGAKLKQISTEARMDMEKLFDGKVYLEVWIKVKSGWADNEAGLRAYGYE